MADAQNKPIQIVPDPQSGPAPAPATSEPTRTSRGLRAATVLGIALVGSLAGNGFQYVEGDALQSELSTVTQERAAVTAERDALDVALAETQQELLQSKGALALVHTGLTTVRQQISALEELTAPADEVAPSATGFEEFEPVAAEPEAAASSDRLAAVERVTPADEEPLATASTETDPALEADAAPTFPAEVAPESGETIATTATESTELAIAEPVEAAIDTTGVEAALESTADVAPDAADAVIETADDRVSAAVSTSVDTASEELAAGEVFMREAVELVSAEAPAASEESSELVAAAEEAVGTDETVTAATELVAETQAAAETETPTAVVEEAPTAPVALPPSRGSFFDRAVDRVGSWF